MEMTVGRIIGLVVVLLLGAIGGFFIVKKSKKYDTVKWLGLFILIAMGLTWVFSYGVYNGAEYYEYGAVQQGISDIANFLYTAIYFSADKLVFLLAVGAFYGILRKNRGYKKLVNRLAEWLKGKEIFYVLVVSLIVTLMTSMLSETFIVIIFIPLLISVGLKIGLDKISAFCMTFGSMLIGLMGTIYGGEGLFWFNYYTQTEVSTGLMYRLIVLIVGYVLFNYLNAMHIRKVKKNKIEEKAVDMYEVEKEEKGYAWPIVVIFTLMFVVVILGYLDWNEIFKITIFDTFHNWLMGLKIGEFEIMKALLGTQVNAFGSWGFLESTSGTSTTIQLGTTVLIVNSVLVALLSRISLSEVIDGIKEGIGKISKCVGMYVLVYALMLVGYMCQFLPTILNLIFSNVHSFNPYLVSIAAGLSHIFNTDIGLTGFMVAGYFTESYAANIELIHTIFLTLYGYVGLLAPTSGLLVIGLSYLDISYKNWFKYIWLFLIGMLVILVALFSIVAYM